MVIKGRSRTNGSQLASYLLTKGQNESIQILDVDGRGATNDNLFRQTLLSMSLTSELSKGNKGLYHAQVNPAYGEDKNMAVEDWVAAADILGKELKLEDHRRVIVLHTKQGRTHAHVVWERYNSQTGKLVSDSFSYKAHDRARAEMEKVFSHERTPVKNQKQTEIKKVLTQLWRKSPTGRDFIDAARKEGFQVARGELRRPFMVVDDEGRSFDLVRQLDQVRTKEVRARLAFEKLPSEKAAISAIRRQQKTNAKAQVDKVQPANDNGKYAKIAAEFSEGRNSILRDNPERKATQRQTRLAEKFLSNEGELVDPSQGKSHVQSLAKNFAQNRQDQVTAEQRKQDFAKKFNPDKQKDKGLGLEPD